MSGLNESAINAISGATAGIVAGIVVCPLDVVKTMLQVQGSYTFSHNKKIKYRGILGSVKTILKEDGIRGLYRGLTPMVLGYIPTWAIYFTVYGNMRNLTPQTMAGDLVSAVSAGACSTIITNPMWVVKTRLMSQNQYTSWHYAGLVDAFKKMWAAEGVGVFYSGLVPALLGLPHVAIQFPLYEWLKQRLIRREQAPAAQVYYYLLASTLSKITASTITYPHEVVRSRNQIRPMGHNYTGVINTVATLYKEEGWRVFYAGLGTNICRAVPASAVTLVTYEFVSFQLRQHFLAGQPVPELPEMPDPTDPLI